MSIEKTELMGPGYSGRELSNHPYGVTLKRRNYGSKALAKEQRRNEYQKNVSREKNVRQTDQIKAQSEKYADINKLNERGQRTPSPEVKYKKENNYRNFSHYNHEAGKTIDRTV